MISDYTLSVYRAEAVAVAKHEPRQLDRTTAQELATRIVGQKVKFFDLSDQARSEGVMAAGIWWRGTPWLTFAEDRFITDFIFAHEVGHLAADRRYNTGHGTVWLKEYAKVIRSLHRPEYANSLLEAVYPIVAEQPMEDRLAALQEPRD